MVYKTTSCHRFSIDGVKDNQVLYHHQGNGLGVPPMYQGIAERRVQYAGQGLFIPGSFPF